MDSELTSVNSEFTEVSMGSQFEIIVLRARVAILDKQETHKTMKKILELKMKGI